MTGAESLEAIKQVKAVLDQISKYSEQAQLDPFLSCYENWDAFLHISMDGKMRDYNEFCGICSDYYSRLAYQSISTITEKLRSLDAELVITGWTGNITAHFKNGDVMRMTNYSISNFFKKINGEWKIIHSHESSLPPDVIKEK